MQVDNSGTTVVLDKKTTQAIEEGKNRITLLQVEELRLKNLKKGMEAEIIKLEADIDYKKDVVNKLNLSVTAAQNNLTEVVEQVNEAIDQRDKILKELKTREESVQAQETALHEKELTLNAEQLRLTELTEKYSKDWAVAEKAKDMAQERIRKIDEFLKSL